MSRITSIRVGRGTTIPHPTKNYASLKFELEYGIEVKEGENIEEATREIQDLVDEKILEHEKRVKEKKKKGLKHRAT